MKCVEAKRGQSCERCGKAFKNNQLVFHDLKEDQLICLEGCFKSLPKGYNLAASKSNETITNKTVPATMPEPHELEDIMGRKLVNDINRMAVK